MRKILFALFASVFLPSAASALCPLPTGFDAESAFYNLLPASNGAVYMGRYGDLKQGGLRRTEGTFYYHKDTKKMMLCDGTNWNTVLSSGGSGADGGSVPPSKERVYGPYSLAKNSTQVLAAIQQPASNYYIVPYLQSLRGNGECSIEMKINGTWKRIAYLRRWLDRVHVDRNEYEYIPKSESVIYSVTANMLPSGNYQMYFGAFSPSMTISEGNFSGEIRFTSDGWDCTAKIVFKRRVEG